MEDNIYICVIKEGNKIFIWDGVFHFTLDVAKSRCDVLNSLFTIKTDAYTVIQFKDWQEVNE